MSWFKDMLGFGKHAGGSRDAFDQYKLYVGQALPYYNEGLTSMFGSGRQINPMSGRFADALQPLDQAQGYLDQLPDLLRNSALASTESGALGGMQAARAMATRGGLAYSGGAANIAARTAAGIAPQQSASLADALLQGMNAKVGLAGQRSNTMMQITSAEAGLADSAFKDEVSYRQNLISSMMGMAPSFGSTGLQGQVAAQQRKFGVLGPLVGNILGY